MKAGRRTFMATSATAAAAAWLGALNATVDALLLASPQRSGGGGPLVPIPGGQPAGTVPLGRFDKRPTPPLNTLLGSGLDSRLFTDLSRLDEDALVTPTDRFFVRTSAPGTTPRAVLEVGGRVARPQTIGLDSIAPLARSAGTHLVECAGNSDPANFGLMSAARWQGIPMTDLLERIQPIGAGWRVQVTGLDEGTSARGTSEPGASWVFARDDLARTGAFLATGMNGSELPPHHGRPIRLIVPGWYGCASIKWVSRIDIVPDDVPATPQMLEFAGRTHQQGRPMLARDYAAPVIEVAAMPIRVERWIVSGRPTYRVVGIVWGGEKPTNAVTIRFRRDEPFVPVSDCPMPGSTTTWSLWSHIWKPPAPGRYRIVLQVADRAVKARRLDMFFYARDVDIEAV